MAALDPQKEEEIENLVIASQRGDSEAFGKLYDIFVDPLYRYAYYRAGAAEAEDLIELVFLKSWENIKQYRPRERSFSSWIFRIAHNVVVDFYRSQRPQDELSENIIDHREEADSRALANRRFDNEVLGKAMLELKDRYRQIIILKFMNDLTNEEIGYITGRSQAALRILQFRALRKLRRILEQMGVNQDSL
jgi:RNA polymerase sigma-70 factor (ECF subfamily)